MQVSNQNPYIHMNKIRTVRSQHFTLIEIVVVALIIGIVATGANAAYKRFADQAAIRTNKHNAATLTSAINNYALNNNGQLPSMLETLTPASFTTGPSETKYYNSYQVVPVSDVDSDRRFLNQSIIGVNATPPYRSEVRSDKLIESVTAGPLSFDKLEGLTAAGIHHLIYLDQNAFYDPNNVSNNTLAIHNVTASPLTDAKTYPTIKNELWDSAFNTEFLHSAPQDGMSDLQCGFTVDLNTASSGDNLPAIYLKDAKARELGYNIQGATHRVLVLGIGINSTLSKGTSTILDASGTVTTDYYTPLSSQPYKAGLGDKEYKNYFMLVDVKESPAKFVGIMDPEGNIMNGM